MVPSGAIGAVPDTATICPTLTALEKPIRDSNGDPDGTSVRMATISVSL